MRKPLLILVFFISACTSAQPAQTSSNVSLELYITSTSSVTSTPDVIVIAESPLPTSTPFIYNVEAGDTLSGIAEKFKISQDDLRAANPDVSPNSMTIGMTLLIPDSSAATADAATLTPVPAPITQIVCHPSADNGLWCFALIQNNTPDILENLSAQITLIDQNNNVIASQTAFMPLDILPPNSSLPVYVFFPNTPANVNPQVQLISAIQLNSNTTRYLPAALNNTIAQINWDGKTAQLSGQIYLPAGSQAATQVWVAAVAYDKDGRVVGIKRWEGGAIQPGAGINFNFSVASLGSAIEAVEFVVQAKP
ncbi:MAG: LysM peptidoglycan-binding domain-containing protein [Anaerolineales bacterium]|nr:LysM peptidoglycan-binding domain-containing protein [Anaerolineales bacterium]